MKKIIFVNKYGNKFIVDGMELAEAVETYRPSIGLDARWLPDFLEGAESRQVLVKEATKEETNFVYDYDMEGKEIPDSGHEVITEAKEAEYVTEYLHPAEYTYEIIEETLTAIKARKLAELSAESIVQNNELKAWNEYRASNILAGLYDEVKTRTYVAAYKSKSEQLRNRYYELKLLVDAATTEAEINNIEFSLQ